jgi:radical SAM family RiPP maturation amino acid epimerase
MKSLDYPKFKRFFEWYHADPAFRDAYQHLPHQILRQFAIDAEPACLDEIAHKHYDLERSERAQLYHDIIRRLLVEPVNHPKFHQWRARQLQRVKALCHVQVFQSLPHIPIVFELSQGCSGQCPFCCFAPPPLQSIFPYTKANRTLWCTLLERSEQIIGPIMRYGLCYYATEPFDNPDYEHFVRDFDAITGWWPQLTTIKHLDNPARIRNYIKMIGDLPLKSKMVRFSITSLDMLKRVHAEYSPEELEHVSVILNNPESSSKYSPAGRARKLVDKNESAKFYLPGLIACVSGFIVNVPAHSIQLVAPCNPDEQHPYGYIQFDTATFADAGDYEEQLAALIERNMPDAPRPNTMLAFHPAFTFEPRPDGIALSTPFLTRHIHGDANWVALGELIHTGQYTWKEVENQFNNLFLTEYYLKPKVLSLFDDGLLAERMDEQVSC